MDDYFVSLIRTWVPVGFGVLITWLAATFNIVVDDGTSALGTAFAVALITAVYYAVSRAVETQFPALGRFLLALGLTGKREVTYPTARR